VRKRSRVSVYRTYLAPGRPVSDADAAVIERAVAAAKRRNLAVEESVFNFLRDILLFRFPENLDEEERAEHVHFVLKFQQSTGPIMAKGLEDTAFYIYNRLAALNDVGGEPQQFGLSIDQFHEQNITRQRDWPGSLLATSTHDTKRSEDVRARMVAISELPLVWRRSLSRWRTLNRPSKQIIDDAEAPDRNEEYLLYQILLGTWPTEPFGEMPDDAREKYIDRIRQYMAKALKEAKVNTSWIRPNEQWDSAMSNFVSRILEKSPKNKFLPSFTPVAEEIARLGAINSLSQLLLKLTAPGVPDIYQGNEIWDYSLVDPDNRRPVDYARRQKMLDGLQNAQGAELLGSWPDGRIKLFSTQRLLLFRRNHLELFQSGSYLPLSVAGTFAECCVGFAREHEDRFILVLAPRLTSRIGFPPLGDRWGDTSVQLPEGFENKIAHDIFTSEVRNLQGSSLALAQIFSTLPFAVLTNAQP
jgi:(1->4)-alpha-D-glucan 1-alpha-D-glucosylmutase